MIGWRQSFFRFYDIRRNIDSFEGCTARQELPPRADPQPHAVAEIEDIGLAPCVS